jgi:uncharacterized protein
MRCPTCNKPVRPPAAGEPMGAFPFCSDRCRLIDLGRWLDGKYQVPVVEEDEDSPSPAPADPFAPDGSPPA